MPTQSLTEHYIEISELVFKPIYGYLCNSVKTRCNRDISEMKVVDLGGGTGYWLEAMLDLGAESGVLIDIEPQMVSYAENRLRQKFPPEKCSTIAASADNIPLPDQSCNTIISRSSMHMWTNLEKCWQEMYRILEPDGVAFLGRGYGPDLPAEIRAEVKQARKALKAQKNPSEAADKTEEPPSPDPFNLAKMAMQIGFKEVSLIKDAKVIWLLARK
jgi:ubiquinone/menaquinone biosynthesis C-methylase UbiE